jgi:hypothetical protein
LDNLGKENMKRIVSFIMMAMALSSFTSSAQAVSVERLFKMSINGKTQFNGRASSVLDSEMLNIHTFMTFRKTYTGGSGWEVSFASNGNRSVNSRTHVLYPTNGEVLFELVDNDGEPVEYSMGHDGNEQLVTHTKKDKTFYIVESDFEYERRMDRVKKINLDRRITNYPETGKFIAIVEFDIQGPRVVDFFELDEEINKLIPIGTYRKSIK